MSWQTADLLSAETTDVLAADTANVLSAEATDVLSAEACVVGAQNPLSAPFPPVSAVLDNSKVQFRKSSSGGT